ncbi:amino acid adenylation domain-containing protein [Streptomyces sp. NPDC059802]|uniref:amino acid adenylation domain-containing protein n=1 Tax=Streptomyces sp. NPDC059802 TaxID=3346952 RepID=UPI0036467AD9
MLELAAVHPDRVAVADVGEELTYAALVRWVYLLRADLLAAGCAPGDRIAVLLRRGLSAPVVFLAAESIGAAYVPLDRDWPPRRLADVLRRSAPRCLVTSPQDAPLDQQADTDSAPTVLMVPQPTGNGTDLPTGDDLQRTLLRRPDPEEARYLIHTSGSTGRPKAVAVSHRGMLNHLSAMVTVLSMGPQDIVAFTAPPSYVISIWQMLAPLLVGGRVAVVNDMDVQFPRRLARRFADAEVTVMELVPSVIKALTTEVGRHPESAPYSALRHLISTGAPLPTALAAEAIAAFPGVELLNAYGCTECSDDVTLHQVTQADLAAPQIPAGRPLPGVTLYVLVAEDGRWRPAAPGESGELWVGGTGVSPGYPDEPELTRSAFFRDPFDPNSPTGRLYRTGDLALFRGGRLHCLGRADRQVKVAAIRVELDEVESAVNNLPGVAGCAVVVDQEQGRARLRAYVVTPGKVTDRELHKAARGVLPLGLVPHSWVRVDALPLTGSGKVDYRRLSLSFASEPTVQL